MQDNCFQHVLNLQKHTTNSKNASKGIHKKVKIHVSIYPHIEICVRAYAQHSRGLRLNHPTSKCICVCLCIKCVCLQKNVYVYMFIYIHICTQSIYKFIVELNYNEIQFSQDKENQGFSQFKNISNKIYYHTQPQFKTFSSISKN